MINLATLRSELQARITAVNGSTPINTLLKRREAAESAGVDQSVIDAEIQARIDAISGATPENDLMLLSKLATRGDKRIGEIVQSPIKADTLNDGALIRMAGVKILKASYPALADVYQDQLLFGVQLSLESAITAAGVTSVPQMYDPVFANGVLMVPFMNGLIRTNDGISFAKVGPSAQFTCVCWDAFNGRWWAGTSAGLIYYSIDNGLTWAVSSSFSNGSIKITSVSASDSGVVLVTYMSSSVDIGGAKYTGNNGSSWATSTGTYWGQAHATYSPHHNAFFSHSLGSTSLYVSYGGADFSASGYFSGSAYPDTSSHYRRLKVFGDTVVLQSATGSYALKIGATGASLGAGKTIGVNDYAAVISGSNYCMFERLFDGSIIALPRAAVTPRPISLFRYLNVFGATAEPVFSGMVGSIRDSYVSGSSIYGGNIYTGMCATPWGLFVSTYSDRSSILIPTKNYSSTEMYLPDVPAERKNGATLYSYVVAK